MLNKLKDLNGLASYFDFLADWGLIVLFYKKLSYILVFDFTSSPIIILFIYLKWDFSFSN